MAVPGKKLSCSTFSSADGGVRVVELALRKPA
jgi:hypothetical protein